MGSKKPFWKKALRGVAYVAGAALVAAGVIAAIGFSGGAAAPFVGIACGAIASTPWLAATVAAGAAALGAAGIAAFLGSRSKKSNGYAQIREQEMRPRFVVAAPDHDQIMQQQLLSVMRQQRAMEMSSVGNLYTRFTGNPRKMSALNHDAEMNERQSLLTSPAYQGR